MTRPSWEIEVGCEVARDELATAVEMALDADEKLEMERQIEAVGKVVWELWRLSGGKDE